MPFTTEEIREEVESAGAAKLGRGRSDRSGFQIRSRRLPGRAFGMNLRGGILEYAAKMITNGGSVRESVQRTGIGRTSCYKLRLLLSCLGVIGQVHTRQRSGCRTCGAPCVKMGRWGHSRCLTCRPLKRVYDPDAYPCSHPRTEENTQVFRGKETRCRTCNREKAREAARAKRRNAQPSESAVAGRHIAVGENSESANAR